MPRTPIRVDRGGPSLHSHREGSVFIIELTIRVVGHVTLEMRSLFIRSRLQIEGVVVVVCNYMIDVFTGFLLKITNPLQFTAFSRQYSRIFSRYHASPAFTAAPAPPGLAVTPRHSCEPPRISMKYPNETTVALPLSLDDEKPPAPDPRAFTGVFRILMYS